MYVVEITPRGEFGFYEISLSIHPVHIQGLMQPLPDLINRTVLLLLSNCFCFSGEIWVKLFDRSPPTFDLM